MTCGMPQNNKQVYGNLSSYKVYVRPAAHKLYGYTDKTKSKHQKNIHNLLHILFTHGTSSTWDMAKRKSRKISLIREQEKIYRRLLIGRTDRGRNSGGILNLGLVIKEQSIPYTKYRLSLYGILYCIDTQDPTKKDIDSMAKNYAFLIPKIFGNWDMVKSALGTDAYNLRILSKGIYLNNIKMARSDNPLYELMSYIHIKYKKNFESIFEYQLVEQISFWFYTYLLYEDSQKLRNILTQDEQLQNWYMDFFKQAKDYYTERLHVIRNSILK